MDSKKRQDDFPSAGADLRQGIQFISATRSLVQAAQQRAQKDVHGRMLDLYWELGRMLVSPSPTRPSGEPSVRRKSLVVTVARALTRMYGSGYSEAALERMIRFHECFPKRSGLKAVEGLHWSHLVAIVSLKTSEEREYYRRECLRQAWTPWRLRQEIRAYRYARNTGNRPKAAPEPPEAGEAGRSEQPSGDLECLGFFGRAGNQSPDARSAVIRSMEDYLLDLGAGFCFVERWKHFQVGPEDHFLDLLLYQRRLRCLFAFGLQFGGSAVPDELMDFYLKGLNQKERLAGENPPLGIQLKADAAGENVRLIQLGLPNGQIVWAQTALPPRAQLHHFFVQAVLAAGAE